MAFFFLVERKYLILFLLFLLLGVIHLCFTHGGKPMRTHARAPRRLIGNTLFCCDDSSEKQQWRRSHLPELADNFLFDKLGARVDIAAG